MCYITILDVAVTSFICFTPRKWFHVVIQTIPLPPQEATTTLLLHPLPSHTVTDLVVQISKNSWAEIFRLGTLTSNWSVPTGSHNKAMIALPGTDCHGIPETLVQLPEEVKGVAPPHY